MSKRTRDPQVDRLLSRRQFAKTGVACGLWLSLGGLDLGCADEPLNPDNVILLWIGQSLEGKVTEASVSRSPISGAAVTFLVSIQNDFKLRMATGTSEENGTYRMSAARNGAPDAYWVLQPPSELADRTSVSVDLILQVGKQGFEGVELSQRITRPPSRTPPVGNLSPYQLTMNASLAPIES